MKVRTTDPDLEKASITFRLDPPDSEPRLHRKEFFATPYGRGEWSAPAENDAELRDWLAAAYRVGEQKTPEEPKEKR